MGLPKINKIKARMIIIHGTDDEVIPYEHSLKLQEKSNCDLITLNGGGHNNLQVYYKDSILTSIKAMLLQ